MGNTKNCSISSCKKPIRASGYCKKHYHSLVFLPKRPLYSTYGSMKNRCYNPNNHKYHRYGSRGISVCQEWLDSYFQFEKDVGPRPSSKHLLDRIDNNGNYEPGNVRWSLPSLSSFNRGVRSTNKTGCSGVEYRQSAQSYVARISVNGIRKNLGTFKTLEEAVSARMKAEELYYQC